MLLLSCQTISWHAAESNYHYLAKLYHHLLLRQITSTMPNYSMACCSGRLPLACQTIPGHASETDSHYLAKLFYEDYHYLAKLFHGMLLRLITITMPNYSMACCWARLPVPCQPIHGMLLRQITMTFAKLFHGMLLRLITITLSHYSM